MPYHRFKNNNNNRFVKLTQHKQSFYHERVENVYPYHANTLRKAGL